MDKIKIEIDLYQDQLEENELKENIEQLQAQLAKQPLNGFSFGFDDMTHNFTITLEKSFFDAHKHNARKGGRRKVYAESQTEKELSITGRERKKRYNYSNIVYELNSGASVADMLNFTNMTQATYYRHLQAMKESTYYNSLDPGRCNDIEYLESIKGNHYF